MALLGKDKEQPENKRGDETQVKQLPDKIENALEQVRSEWKIFLQRLERLQAVHFNDSSKADKKKALSHAKHAAMCVRDALKEFGRVTV